MLTILLCSPRFDSVQQELNKSSAQNKELQREMERLQSEVTRYKNLQLKAVKDCEKYKEERDSVFNEYRLIMSERDQVIKELDKLQTELEAAEARLKNTSSERVVASEELEALRQVSGLRTHWMYTALVYMSVRDDALLICRTVTGQQRMEAEPEDYYS